MVAIQMKSKCKMCSSPGVDKVFDGKEDGLYCEKHREEASNRLVAFVKNGNKTIAEDKRELYPWRKKDVE